MNINNVGRYNTYSKATEKTAQAENSEKSKGTAEYMSELSKLAPGVECRVGNGFSSAKTGKTLTINPQLLEKMQNDPEKAKEMTELIKGVESATKLFDGANSGSGWNVAFRHMYIDENGKCTSIALVRNDFMLNLSDKLREERRQNSERLFEKQKETAGKKKEELQEISEKKQAENEAVKETPTKAARLLDEKVAASKDGMIYLNDADIKTIIDAAKVDNTDKSIIKGQTQTGANLDLQA